MTETDFAVHFACETHEENDGESAANVGVKPTAGPPRSTHTRANTITKPSKPSPGKLKRKPVSNAKTIARPASAPPPLVSRNPKKPSGGELIVNGQDFRETQSTSAIDGDSQSANETQHKVAIATILELCRSRQSWHRAEKSLTLQGRAICRRYTAGDKAEADKLFDAITDGLAHPAAGAIAPLMMGREPIKKQRLMVEKEMAKLAKSLPVYEWCEPIRGLGALSLALLVGECGDIGSYKSVSAVWKRMGLAVIDGGRQRKVTGPDALLHGYSPQRRAVAWNIGVSLMRAQKAGDIYRDFYDREKEKKLAMGRTKGHAHNHACRVMTKRLLANLYGAWTGKRNDSN